jgi:hypothetical protein
MGMNDPAAPQHGQFVRHVVRWLSRAGGAR